MAGMKIEIDVAEEPHWRTQDESTAITSGWEQNAQSGANPQPTTENRNSSTSNIKSEPVEEADISPTVKTEPSSSRETNLNGASCQSSYEGEEGRTHPVMVKCEILPDSDGQDSSTEPDAEPVFFAAHTPQVTDVRMKHRDLLHPEMPDGEALTQLNTFDREAAFGPETYDEAQHETLDGEAPVQSDTSDGQAPVPIDTTAGDALTPFLCFDPAAYLLTDSERTERRRHLAKLRQQRFRARQKKLQSPASEQTAQHTTEKPFMCEVCAKTFTRADVLKSHIRTHTGQKPFTCDVCQKRFSQSKRLKAHKMNMHSSQKPFTCDVCNKTFTYQSNLKVHKRTFHSGQKYACDVCDKVFAFQSYLKTHKMTVHVGHRPFACDECGKTFAHQSNFRTHKMIAHSGQKPFVCDVCHKTFAHPSYLKVHKVTHTGEKPFKCGTCQKTFTQQSTLKTHQRNNSCQKPCTREKPYVCEVCSKTFTMAASLKKHRISHTGEKPYKCDVCNMAFSQTCILKQHQLVHQEPLKCDMCSRTFSRPRSLEIHKFSHSGHKPFECTVCSKTFAHESYLKKHHQYSHSDVQKSFLGDVLSSSTLAQNRGVKNHKVIHVGLKPL